MNMIKAVIFDKEESPFVENLSKAGLIVKKRQGENLLAQVLNTVDSPSECLVVSNSKTIHSNARSAGCRSMGTEEQLAFSGADLVISEKDFGTFSSLSEFNDVFDSKVREFRTRSFAGKLMEEASSVLKNAYAKYSHFRVGAAILSETGRIYSGCNVENASYGATICAERNAATTAVAQEGPSVRFAAFAVASESEEPAPPCAICRQFLSEFCNPDTQVYLISLTSGIIRHYNFKTIMPLVFELKEADN